MTLIVSIRAKDGVVLASDSRGTFGDPRGPTAQNDSMKKIYGLNRLVAIGLAGAGEIGAALLEAIRSATKPDSGVTEEMKSVNTILRTSYGNMFANFQIQQVPGVGLPVRPSLSVTICGYDRQPPTPAIPRLYTMDSPFDFATQLHEYGFSVQGIPQFAVYLLNRLYRPDTVLKEASSLAAYTITETAAQDGKVGGPIQMITITPEKGCVELKKEEVDSIVKGNEDRTARLRELFFERK